MQTEELDLANKIDDNDTILKKVQEIELEILSAFAKICEIGRAHV